MKTYNEIATIIENMNNEIFEEINNLDDFITFEWNASAKEIRSAKGKIERRLAKENLTYDEWLMWAAI